MSGPNKGEPEALVAFEPLPRLIPCKTTISTRMERALVQLRRADEVVAAYAQAPGLDRNDLLAALELGNVLNWHS
jgi:hypothetical protein